MEFDSPLDRADDRRRQLRGVRSYRYVTVKGRRLLAFFDAEGKVIAAFAARDQTPAVVAQRIARTTDWLWCLRTGVAAGLLLASCFVGWCGVSAATASLKASGSRAVVVAFERGGGR